MPSLFSAALVGTGAAVALATVGYTIYNDANNRAQRDDERKKRVANLEAIHVSQDKRAAERAHRASTRDAEFAPSAAIFLTAQQDLVFDSLLGLKARASRLCRMGLGVPMLGEPPADAVVLAALLLWGDLPTFHQLYYNPRFLGSPSRLFDFNVVDALGFTLSSLTRSSARVVHGWLEGLAGPRLYDKGELFTAEDLSGLLSIVQIFSMDVGEGKQFFMLKLAAPERAVTAMASYLGLSAVRAADFESFRSGNTREVVFLRKRC